MIEAPGLNDARLSTACCLCLLKARDRDLDLLGVIVVAAITAIRWGLQLPVFRKF